MSVENNSGGVSMKDIAKACGVSVVTVSRALKGDRNHSPETRARIVEAAERLGYRPSPLVSALMSARGRHKPAKSTVNLALLNPGGEWPGHPFYEGARAQARALGFSTEMFTLSAKNGGGGEGARLRAMWEARGVRGVLVLPSIKAETRLEVDLSGFATATIGYSVIAPNMPRVVTDTYGRVMEALNRVEARGYRRIGVLGTDDLDRRFQHLSMAAVQVFLNTGKRTATVERLNVDPAVANRSICAEVLAWVKRRKLDVIVAQLSVYEGLRAAGLSIPEDLGYVYLHATDNPVVTSMDQNQSWIGRKATDVVVGMINRNEFQVPEQSQTIMIPSRWCEGTTLPQRRKM